MRLLVIRTSAMGDVALTAPVLAGMRKQYPQIELLLLTRSAFRPFFSSIKGLQVFSPDFRNRHKGFIGILRLFSDLRKEGKIDQVVDLHDVLRSRILRFFFMMTGVPVSIINKGRREKRSVIRGKIKTRLKHSVERYYDVFSKAGYPVTPILDGPAIVPSAEAKDKVSSLIGDTVCLNIGVAPYAKHNLKMWPEKNMVLLLEMITRQKESKFWLFSGTEESERLDAFQKRVPSSQSIAGILSLDEELALMSKLDFMIAMDSSNMHMAALVGTKVISIWGGTDPLNGFGAWNQPESFSVRIPVNELKCRPCTIYGKGKCKRGDLACLNWLTVKMVYQRIENLL
jgi:ADP-heptose:LPS heptosyltransferase